MKSSTILLSMIIGLLLFIIYYQYIITTHNNISLQNVNSSKIQFDNNVPNDVKLFVEHKMYKYKQYNPTVFNSTLNLLNNHFKNPLQTDAQSIVNSFNEMSFSLQVVQSFDHHDVCKQLSTLLNANDVKAFNIIDDNYVEEK